MRYNKEETKKDCTLGMPYNKKEEKKSDGQKKKGRFDKGEIVRTLRMCYNKEKHRTSMPRRKKASMLRGKKERKRTMSRERKGFC